MRQLKDFMDEGGDRVNRQRRSTGGELSDGHEAVVSDNSDNEDAPRHQPVSRSGGRHGRGRPGTSTRGWYGEMRQQHGDSVSDDSERQRYSNVRGRGFRNDRGRQRRGYGPRVNERREDPRNVEYHADTSHGPGTQSIACERKYDDRQPVNVESAQSNEDWNEEIDVGQSSGQHRERFRATTTQPSRTLELRQSYSDHRASDNVRSQRQEDRHVPTEPPRRVHPTEPPRRVHPTRTISNRNYHTADTFQSRDRSNQIGGIVDAMKEISVKSAADDEAQRYVAPKTAMIVTGMHC